MLRRGEQGWPTTGIAGESGHACIEEAEATCVQVRELIRLRHYSYRTEQITQTGRVPVSGTLSHNVGLTSKPRPGKTASSRRTPKMQLSLY